MELVDLENKLETKKKEIKLPHVLCLKTQKISFGIHAPTHDKDLVNKDDEIIVEEYVIDKFFKPIITNDKFDECQLDFQAKFMSRSILNNFSFIEL